MWKVEICISMSFVEYVSSYSLNVSIQLAILHPWMFLHLIWYSLPSNSRYLVWNCFEFTTAVWFWHPEYIADKKIVYVQWFFFYVVQHFFPGIFSLKLDDYMLELFIMVFTNKLKYLIISLFCRFIGHLAWRREQTPALKTSLHLTSLLPGGQWKSYMMLAKPVQLVWVTSHQRNWGTCLL